QAFRPEVLWRPGFPPGSCLILVVAGLATATDEERGLTTGNKGKGAESGSKAPALQRARVLSGMRPTGRMHIGNYFGALANWVRLQNERMPGAGQEPTYECFYFIADWHSLTSDYAETSGIAQNVIEIATDYLAGGLDPEKHPNC